MIHDPSIEKRLAEELLALQTKNKLAIERANLRKVKQQKKLEQKQQRITQNKKPNFPYWTTYSEYLQTEWWQWRRKQKLKRERYRCERCGKKAWQVHHKHYQTLGREKNSDLEAVCGSCHKYEHFDAISAGEHLDSI